MTVCMVLIGLSAYLVFRLYYVVSVVSVFACGGRGLISADVSCLVVPRVACGVGGLGLELLKQFQVYWQFLCRRWSAEYLFMIYLPSIVCIVFRLRLC